jgi:hypothetical protein
MVLIREGEARLLRRDIARGFVHTYSRTPTTEGAEDPWFEAGNTAGTVQTGRPCRYSPTERLRSDERGIVTISQPSIAIPHDDALAVGDRVSSILDAGGVVLLAGSLTVESVEPIAAGGYVLSKRAVLRGGEPR